MAGKSATKAPSKRDDAEQSERFLKAAREHGADETEEGADKAFKKVVGKPKRKGG